MKPCVRKHKPTVPIDTTKAGVVEVAMSISETKLTCPDEDAGRQHMQGDSCTAFTKMRAPWATE
jgi:hypothetical protein